jgi:hypothetical protein
MNSMPGTDVVTIPAQQQQDSLANIIFKFLIGGTAATSAGIAYDLLNRKNPTLARVISSAVNGEQFLVFSVEGVDEFERRFKTFWQKIGELPVGHYGRAWAVAMVSGATLKAGIIATLSLLAAMPYYASIFSAVTNKGESPASYTSQWLALNIIFVASYTYLYVAGVYKALNKLSNWMFPAQNQLPAEADKTPENGWLKALLYLCVASAITTSLGEWWGTGYLIMEVGETEALLPASLSWFATLLRNPIMALLSNAMNGIFTAYHTATGNYLLAKMLFCEVLPTVLCCKPPVIANSKGPESMQVVTRLIHPITRRLPGVSGFLDNVQTWPEREYNTENSKRYHAAITLLKFAILSTLAFGSIYTIMSMVDNGSEGAPGNDWYRSTLTEGFRKVLSGASGADAFTVNGSSIYESWLYRGSGYLLTVVLSYLAAGVGHLIAKAQKYRAVATNEYSALTEKPIVPPTYASVTNGHHAAVPTTNGHARDYVPPV